MRSASKGMQLCANGCWRLTDRRRPITRVDISRIRTRTHPNEDVAELIDESWRRFEYPGGPGGRVAIFVDPEFPMLGRDAVYYARAFEAPSQTGRWEAAAL